MTTRGLAVLGGLLALFLGLPIVALLARAVRTSGLAGDVLTALALSLATTLIALAVILLLGTPLAWLLARRHFPGRGLVAALVELPIVLPPAVAGLALLLLFGRNGPLGAPLAAAGLSLPFSTAAVVMAQVFVSAPFYVSAARAGFLSVPHELEDAARIDGASEWSVLRRVTLPLAAASLGAGAVMAWARALGEFGATIMFAGNIAGVTQTLPLAVYSEFQSDLDRSIAAAAILVLAALGILLAVRFLDWRRAPASRSVM